MDDAVHPVPSRLSTIALLCLLLAGAFPDGSPAAPGASPSPGARPGKLADVITGEAVSTPGLFTVHRLGNRIYYEIPRAALARDMLWYTEVTKAPAGIGHGGAAIGSRTVRWERVGDRVLLRLLSFEKRAEVDEEEEEPPAVQRAVEDSSLPPIVMAFEVEAEGADGSAVIDVTRLLTSDVEEFSAARIFAQSGVSVRGGDGRPNVDPARSYVERIRTFPSNIEAQSVITFRVAPPGMPDPVTRRAAAVPPGNIRSASLVVHYSMTLLPEEPMPPRLFDPRVGYFADSYEDYSRGERKVMTRRYINRFRLEKKDPAQPVSEPRKPIVFFIGREVPEEWRPFIRRAVEDWRQPFEGAGFRNAIQARDAPSEAEDPGWDPEDTRYSVIRWGAVPVQNAIGPSVSDPRTGEILSANVVIYQDILKLAQNWYFSMCAATDPRARSLPFPDALKGEILRYIVAHEVGHALGLRHNHKASSAYSVSQLRDPKFTARYGTVASIMSYGRFNYVAQPGDNVVQLMPRIGPYDDFAIAWGYMPVPGADSPDAEAPALDRMAARQIDNGWLRFGGEDGPALVDPTVKIQSIGDDPIRSTELGLRNLDRALALLLPATVRLGKDFSELKEAYYALLDTRNGWLSSVAELVGGVVENRTLGGRGGAQFVRVPAERQKQAIAFLVENGFSTPRALGNPELLGRFRYLGVWDPVVLRQRQLLEQLLSEKRYRLLKDSEALDPAGAYTLLRLLRDVQAGLFRELDAPRPTVDIFRRELQRQYLAHIGFQLASAAAAPARRGAADADEAAAAVGPSPTASDFRAVARGALSALSGKLSASLPSAGDEISALHFQDCIREIGRALEQRP